MFHFYPTLNTSENQRFLDVLSAYKMKHNIGLEWTERFKTHKWGMCVTDGIIVYEEFGI